MRKIIYEEDNILLDEGSFFGKGVFETILWRDEAIFLQEHIERLKKGMKTLGLKTLEEDELINFLNVLDVRNKAVKVMVTPLNIVITKRDIPYKKEDYGNGFTLNISKVRRNSSSNLTYIKSTCYVENMLEKEKAKKVGFDDVLFLNEKGFVTETSCSNIFIIKNQRIITPKIENGLLDGIIRKWVIKNFKVQEEDVLYEDLEYADEVFITNSLMGIMKVKRVGEFVYNKESTINVIKNSYDSLIYKSR